MEFLISFFLNAYTCTHKPGKGQGYWEGRRSFKTTNPRLFLSIHSNWMEQHGMSGWERSILFLQHSFHFIRLFIKYLCTRLSISFCVEEQLRWLESMLTFSVGLWEFLVGVASSSLALLPHGTLVSSSHDLLVKTLWLVRYEGFL